MAYFISYVSGPDDGQRFSADSEDAKEAEEANLHFLVFTDKGRLGKRFAVLRSYNHLYEVID